MLLTAITGPSPAAADPADSVATTIGSVRIEADFTHPLPAGGAVVTDETIWQGLYRLIDDSHSGASIHVAFFDIRGNQDVVDHLLDAKGRGVDVSVLHSGHDQSAEAHALRTGLGTAKHRWCDKYLPAHGTNNRACISTDPDGAMHAKYALFSQTRDKTGASQSDVVWISSANMSLTSGARTFNNALTVYGDADLYTKVMDGIWAPMWAHESYPGNDFYDAPSRGYVKSAATDMTLYVSPEQDMDLIARRLQDAVPGPGCEIRVMHNRFTSDRPAVANELVRLKNGGCDVRVMAFDDDGSPRISPSIRTQLQNAGIPIRRTLIHDKTILTKSRFGSSTHLRTIVWSGSHNLNLGSLTKHEEIFTKLESQDIYDGYLQHWENAWSVAL